MESQSAQKALCTSPPFIHPLQKWTSLVPVGGQNGAHLLCLFLCACQHITIRATQQSLPCVMLLCMSLQLLPSTQGDYFSAWVYTCAQAYALRRCMPCPLEHPCLLLFGIFQAVGVYILSHSIMTVYGPKSVNKATFCHLFLTELDLNSGITQPTNQAMKEKKMTIF